MKNGRCINTFHVAVEYVILDVIFVRDDQGPLRVMAQGSILRADT